MVDVRTMTDDELRALYKVAKPEVTPPAIPAPATTKPLGEMSDEELKEAYEAAKTTGAPPPEGGTIVDPVMQGLFASFADEAVGAFGGAMDWAGFGPKGSEGTFDEGYERTRDKARGNYKAYSERNPIASTAAEIGGGVASLAVPVGGAILKGGSLLAKTGRGATAGAGAGALAGYGQGEGGVPNRLRRSLESGIVGGLVGGAAAPIGRGIGKMAGALLSPGRSASSRAGRMITDDLAAEGSTLREALARRREMGPDAMLADTSDMLRYRAEQIAQTDVPARARVISRLKERQAGSKDRLTDAYDASLGSRGNLYEDTTALAKAQKDTADRLYGQARAENLPVDVSPAIRAIDDQMLTPIEQIAGKPSSLPSDEVDKALSWVRGHLSNAAEQKTGIADLDRLERRIRARVTAAFKSGNSDVGHALNEIDKVLVRQMKDSSPVYRQARQTFRDDQGVRDALDKGLGVFSAKEHPDFWAAEIAALPIAEQEALRKGIRAAVDRAMGSVKNGSLSGRTLLNADWNEQKIIAALGPEEGGRLVKRLLNEQEMAATAQQALGNSATARRQDNPFTTRPVSGAQARGVLRNAGNLDFGDAVATAAAKLGSMGKGRGARKVADEIADALTSTGAESDRLAKALLRSQRRNRIGDPVDRMTRALIGVGGVAAAPHQVPPYLSRR